MDNPKPSTNQILLEDTTRYGGIFTIKIYKLNELRVRGKNEFLDVVKYRKIWSLGPVQLAKKDYKLTYGEENNELKPSVGIGFSTTKVKL